MIEFNHSGFSRRFIDGRGEMYEGLRFNHCRFDYCSFSITDQIDDRSIARNIEVNECEVSQCSIGPGILEQVTINRLNTLTLPICWGTLFKHVRLKGSVGKIKINPETRGMNLNPFVQTTFDEDRQRFYQDVDWALDISEARFVEFDMRGVPARLVRMDSRTQGVITRESASHEVWRHSVRSRNRLWVFVIDDFLRAGDADLVVAVPKDAPARKYRELLESFMELKDLGVIL